MTQDAIVTKCLPGGMAEVVVTRMTACGSNCGNCESCVYQSELKTTAKNLIAAQPGQKVLIESRSSKIYKAALLVYIVPIVLMVLGYVLASVLGGTEGICILCCFIGLIVGGVILVLSEKARKKNNDSITFDIVQFI